MKRAFVAALYLVLALPGLMVAPLASAQLIGPNIAPSNPPPPAPPPPPKIEVPKIPQFDAPPRNNLAAPRRRSFGDRVTKCLEEGAAAGLNANDRAAYSRACANQQ